MSAVSVTLKACSETARAMQQSLDALVAGLALLDLSEAFEGVAGLADRYGLGLADERDLFRVEISLRAARGAADQDVFRILPSQGYIELVSAVAMDCGSETVVSHGWPVLSVVSPKATVAEGVASFHGAAPEAGA